MTLAELYITEQWLPFMHMTIIVIIRQFIEVNFSLIIGRHVKEGNEDAN